MNSMRDRLGFAFGLGFQIEGVRRLVRLGWSESAEESNNPVPMDCVQMGEGGRGLLAYPVFVCSESGASRQRFEGGLDRVIHLLSENLALRQAARFGRAVLAPPVGDRRRADAQLLGHGPYRVARHQRTDSLRLQLGRVAGALPMKRKRVFAGFNRVQLFRHTRYSTSKSPDASSTVPESRHRVCLQTEKVG